MKMKAIVLAAGKGTRINSGKENIPKVLRKLNGCCLIDYCLKCIDFINNRDMVIVVGFKREEVQEYLGDSYCYAIQEKQIGTGDAALCARDAIGTLDDDVLVIYGDMPLIRRETILSLIEKHRVTGADMTILTANPKNMLPYGRIIRDSKGSVIDIIEENDVNESVKNINELNVGVVVAKLNHFFDGLTRIEKSQNSGEYYLTGLTRVFVQEGRKIETYTTTDEEEIRGVNTVEDLNFAAYVLHKRYSKNSK